MPGYFHIYQLFAKSDIQLPGQFFTRFSFFTVAMNSFLCFYPNGDTFKPPHMFCRQRTQCLELYAHQRRCGKEQFCNKES